MGVPDYLGWSWKSKAGVPIVCVPGCPIQSGQLRRRRAAYLLYQAAGQAPMIPLDEALRPTWLFGDHRPRGLRPGRLLRAGRLRHRYGSPKCIVKLGCWGPVVKCNVPKRAGSTASAAAPTSAASASAAPCPASPTSSCPSWTSRPAPSCLDRGQRHVRTVIQPPGGHGQDRRQGAEVAQDRPRADHRLPPELVGEGSDDHDRTRRDR